MSSIVGTSSHDDANSITSDGGGCQASVGSLTYKLMASMGGRHPLLVCKKRPQHWGAKLRPSWEKSHVPDRPGTIA